MKRKEDGKRMQTCRLCDLFDGRLEDRHPALAVILIIGGKLDRRGRLEGRGVLGDDFKRKVALVLAVLEGLHKDIAQVDRAQWTRRVLAASRLLLVIVERVGVQHEPALLQIATQRHLLVQEATLQRRC